MAIQLDHIIVASRDKHAAAKRWVSAVNHWGQLGTWLFHVCFDPQRLAEELASL